ncbi:MULTISPECIES: hypothetical protein [unclassified Niallia]|uniref:hypothetical protein n=1 Tax=unclassified Niallia TaxID=2837522 RepID=UPI002040DA78|nr:hypothetical protein [Niallia sp. MER 6]MCM3033195.1 hypothetical protein [Niallia sp. MER 6]
MTERGLLNTKENLEPSKVYQLIDETIEKNHFKGMTRYFCDQLDVSHSGYYRYLKAFTSREARKKTDLEAKEVILKTFNRRGYKKDDS